MSESSTAATTNVRGPTPSYERPGPCWCNDDQTTGGHWHEQRGGMADRVHIDRNGTRYNAGLSFVLPVCELCGALVVDDYLHDRFHAELA